MMVAPVALTRLRIMLGLKPRIGWERRALFNRTLDPAIVVAADIALVAIWGDFFSMGHSNSLMLINEFNQQSGVPSGLEESARFGADLMAVLSLRRWHRTRGGLKAHLSWPGSVGAGGDYLLGNHPLHLKRGGGPPAKHWILLLPPKCKGAHQPVTATLSWKMDSRRPLCELHFQDHHGKG
jgi:hypothetical protein